MLMRDSIEDEDLNSVNAMQTLILNVFFVFYSHKKKHFDIRATVRYKYAALFI